MKIFPSTILNEIEKKPKNIYPILFYGNERGLISGLIKSTHNIVQTKFGPCDIKYFDHKHETKEEFESLLNSSSLFSNTIFIIIKNPQERLIAELTSFDKLSNIIIINGENITTRSKIKSYFDSHQSLISVPCYSLNRIYIKKTIDNFIKKNNILLDKESYRFLVNNISEDYLTLENELQKLYTFKYLPANLKDLQKLIIPKNNINTDNYFFNCATGNFKLILQDINFSNKSINDSYEIFISLKRLIHVLSGAVSNRQNYNLDDLVKNYLPKYLFLKKEIFKEILIKINLNKIIKINKMLQKTEYLLRKNADQHREILERLLLNLVKIMK